MDRNGRISHRTHDTYSGPIHQNHQAPSFFPTLVCVRVTPITNPIDRRSLWDVSQAASCAASMNEYVIGLRPIVAPTFL